MAYLLAFVGWMIDLIPYTFTQPSMVISEGLVPSLLGAATVLVIYWFAKTLFNTSAGIIAGVLASFSHILILRTMKGFVFHDALSLFLIILTVVAFWHALKTIENQFRFRQFGHGISWICSLCLCTYCSASVPLSY
jgi:asparagine N-glycosylation enzyme membrane subunit Stt3